MMTPPWLTAWRRALLGLGLAGLIALPAAALEKEGMPDLSQIEQTCLPTSTANLIVWFGTHGYPKLIVSGDSKDDDYIHTVHRIMTDTDARFDWGTRQDAVTVGIEKYIHDAGYNCDVEYRGLDYGDKSGKKPVAFSQDWLKGNDDPNKGFILLLVYCKYDEGNHIFTNAWNAGHAVTLVNAEPDMILIHDPAHYEDETGRKILTPQVLTGGSWQEVGMTAPVSGLLLLSGSLLEAPPDARVMVTGAVCVTMRPADAPNGPASPSVAGPNPTLAGNGASSAKPSTPAAPSTPSSASTSWMMWLFDLIFKK